MIMQVEKIVIDRVEIEECFIVNLDQKVCLDQKFLILFIFDSGFVS